MKKIRQKRFTLIELMTVIVIIGVLAAIVIPNISNFKQDATITAMKANIKNIETALTFYLSDNDGKLPILKKPEVGLPEALLIDELYPKYLRQKPEVKGMKYWVDDTYNVWASSADSPIGITYTTDGKLKWNETKNAVSFNVYKAENNEVKSSAFKRKIVFVGNVNKNEITLPKLMGDEFYLVNSVDDFGLESPPVKSEYQGNVIESEIPKTGLSQKENFLLPMTMEEVKWKNNIPAMTDGNDTTFHTLGGSEEYIFEWQGDMANRVFQITFSTGSGSSLSKELVFLDKNGANIPFINAKTDEKYNSYLVASNLTKRTIEFVVPKGATQLKIHGTAVINLFTADFVDDLSLPYSVENVYSETTNESLTLKWNSPTNAENFLKVAIYEGDNFLGYSSNGTFTINSLYSDTGYMYSIEPISVVGNRGPRVEHTNKTFRPEIVWKGLENANAFDSLENTYAYFNTGSVVSWEGNLDNRQINFIYSTPGNTSTSQAIVFAFFDKEGNKLDSRRASQNELLSNQTLYGGRNILNSSFVVPEGAQYIEFLSNNSKRFAMHSLNHGIHLELPSKLTNVEATPAEKSITFNFNRPSDVTRVAVIRDGQFVSYTTSDNFTDTSLYSDQEFVYTFETFNSLGHRTPIGGGIIARTTKAEIVWRGLSNANAFDGFESTYSPFKVGDIISWKGNLDNRQITIDYQSPGNTSTAPYAEFGFFDKEGNQLNSRVALSEILSSTQKLYGGRNMLSKSFVVPEGATSIKFLTNYYASNFVMYDISYGNSLDLPSPLTDIQTTSTKESITLTFSRPSDVQRVAVIRDGNFVGYTTTNMFTDTSLYSNKEYHYSFETFNLNGHSNPRAGTVVGKTLKPEIVWSGLDNASAFDSSSTTFANVMKDSIIQWEGNLSNRQIDLTYSPSDTSSSAILEFSFYNDDGNIVPSRTVSSTTLVPVQRITGSYSSTQTLSLIVPEGATNIKFTKTLYNLKLKLYSIKEQ